METELEGCRRETRETPAILETTAVEAETGRRTEQRSARNVDSQILDTLRRIASQATLRRGRNRRSRQARSGSRTRTRRRKMIYLTLMTLI